MYWTSRLKEFCALNGFSLEPSIYNNGIFIGQALKCYLLTSKTMQDARAWQENEDSVRMSAITTGASRVSELGQPDEWAGRASLAGVRRGRGQSMERAISCVGEPAWTGGRASEEGERSEQGGWVWRANYYPPGSLIRQQRHLLSCWLFGLVDFCFLIYI